MGAIPFVCIQAVMAALVIGFHELVSHEDAIEPGQIDLQLPPPEPPDAPPRCSPPGDES